MPESLEKELETYKKNLPSLIADEGKFVVIQGSEILGVFGTYEDALTAGYKKFGIKPFLVKKIMAVEQVQYFTRDIVEPCRT